MDFKSLREFKSGLTAAFDTAQVGEKVNITRRGVRYLLVSEDAVKEARKQTPPENKKNNSGASPISSAGPMPEPIPDDNLAAGEWLCCQRDAPCKHWTWDIQGGEGYVNSLSGRIREAS